MSRVTYSHAQAHALLSDWDVTPRGPRAGGEQQDSTACSGLSRTRVIWISFHFNFGQGVFVFINGSTPLTTY